MILNVGAGDTKLSFDPKNPAERIRAARIVTDMIRRGYALLVEVRRKGAKPVYQRVHEFRESVCEYIIADFDPVEAAEADAKEKRDEQPTGAKAPARGRAIVKRAIKAESANAVAVARSAGG